MTELQKLQKRLQKEKELSDVLICSIEEMSELTKVITKYLRESSKFSKEKLIEEIAHVSLMVDTVRNMFDIDNRDIEKEKILALKKCFKIKEE